MCMYMQLFPVAPLGLVGVALLEGGPPLKTFAKHLRLIRARRGS